MVQMKDKVFRTTFPQGAAQEIRFKKLADLDGELKKLLLWQVPP